MDRGDFYKIKEDKADGSLFERARRLDKDAFEKFYSEYLTPVYRYFAVRVKNKVLAEDLTHTTFLKAWEHAETLKDASLSVAWFFAIARNVMIDYWRKKKEILVEDETLLEVPDDKKDAQDDYEYKRRLESVSGALEQLSDDQKEMILLKFFEGLSNKEIEKITKKSQTAIRALQYRALESLKKILGT